MVCTTDGLGLSLYSLSLLSFQESSPSSHIAPVGLSPSKRLIKLALTGKDLASSAAENRNQTINWHPSTVQVQYSIFNFCTFTSNVATLMIAVLRFANTTGLSLLRCGERLQRSSNHSCLQLQRLFLDEVNRKILSCQNDVGACQVLIQLRGFTVYVRYCEGTTASKEPLAGGVSNMEYGWNRVSEVLQHGRSVSNDESIRLRDLTTQTLVVDVVAATAGSGSCGEFCGLGIQIGRLSANGNRHLRLLFRARMTKRRSWRLSKSICQC